MTPTREEVEVAAHVLGLRHMSGDDLHLPSAADFIERLAADNAALRERLEAAEAETREAISRSNEEFREHTETGRKLRDAEAERDLFRGRWANAHRMLDEAEAALTEARAREAAAWEAGRDAAGLLLEERDHYGLADDVYCELTPPTDATAARRAEAAAWNDAIEAVRPVALASFASGCDAHELDEDIRALRRNPKEGV